MSDETYQEAKVRIESTLGPATWDYDRSPTNESARQLAEFKGRQMALGRAKKRQELEKKEETPIKVEANEVKEKLSNLSGLVPLDDDLSDFKGVNKEILRIYLVNQDISPKKLANSFGVSYQSVAGLLNSKAVQVLRAKYFHKQLDNNTKIGLLKLTEDADSKVVLAAAEYLKLLQDKEKDDDSSFRLQDPKAEKALTLLGDWLAGDEESITINREQLG